MAADPGPTLVAAVAPSLREGLGGARPPARGLVIEPGAEGVRLLSHGPEGEDLGDTLHASIREAQEQSVFTHGDRVSAWLEVPAGVAEPEAWTLERAPRLLAERRRRLETLRRPHDVREEPAGLPMRALLELAAAREGLSRLVVRSLSELADGGRVLLRDLLPDLAYEQEVGDEQRVVVHAL